MQTKSQNSFVKESLDNKLKISEREIDLKYGEIKEETIPYNEYVYINLNDSANDELIHIFSINCHINVDFENCDNCSDSIHIINNDAYSIYINNNTNKTNNTKIKLSINQNDDDLKKRKCPLVINRMNMIDVNTYYLIVEEHNPTIFYFNENLQKIILNYKSKDFTDKSFLVFSFLFDEKASFEVSVEDLEYNKNRNISGSHNIFLTQKSFKNKKIFDLDLNIRVRRIGEKNKPVLLTFRVISNKFSPLILQKNYLNQGFITSNLNYMYFYMEIFNGEEGEIMLHDKRLNGKLIGRICEINKNITFNDSNIFVGNDTLNIIKELDYKENIRKLTFKYKETEKCENGCYLLISYNNNASDNYDSIIGFEFTLLTRIWDKEDWSKTNIVKIPNNEYIFGYFEINSINQHYYSILLNNSTNLYIEIRGKNYKIFYGEGNRKLNTYNNKLDTINELKIENEIEMTNISNIDYNNSYLSFAIRPTNFFEDIASFYYFRIFQVKDFDNLIMPLDSNIGNNYKSLNKSLNNNESLNIFYLLKNDYNEFLLNFEIYTSNAYFNLNDSDKVYIFELYKNQDLDLRDEKLIEYQQKVRNITGSKHKLIENPNNYNLNFILFKFELNYQNEETFLTFMDDKNNEIYPQVYSPQIFKLETNDSFKFYALNESLKNYYYTLKWINGVGDFHFPSLDYDLEMDINNKDNYYSSPISEITFNNTEEFFLFTKLNYNFESHYIREIKSGELIIENILEDYFPLYFFFKRENKSSYDINFRIVDFKNLLANYDIKVMGCDLDTINKITRGEYINFDNKDNNDIKDNKNNQETIEYDISTKNGLIKIRNVSFSNNTNYYVIKIEQKNKIYKNNLLMQIILFDIKTENNIFWYREFPINQYIVGSINKSENIKIDIFNENNKDKDNLIVEFNKNNQGIEIEFDSDYDKNQVEGIEKYIIGNLSTKNSIYIKYNETKASKGLLGGYYLLRYYYPTKKFIDCNYNFTKEFSVISKDQKGNNITIITLEFNNLKINPKTYVNENISYIIYLNLYSLNESKNELLKNSTIMYTNPIYQNYTIVKYNQSKFQTNITINSTNVVNYEYIAQIIFYLNDTSLNYEMLTYSIDFDFTNILKEKDKDDDNDNEKILVISLVSIVSLFVIVGIIVFIYISKMKKKNKELKDKVLSISFAEGKGDDILTAESMHSKKDEEYESVFI